MKHRTHFLFGFISVGVISLFGLWGVSANQVVTFDYRIQEALAGATHQKLAAPTVLGAERSSTCSVLEEYNDLRSVMSDSEALDKLVLRYSKEQLPLPNADFFLANLRNVGDSVRDPLLGYETTLISTSINNINSERNHVNADESLAFFRTGSRVWQVFDTTTGRRLYQRSFVYGGINPTDSVRWHPTLPTTVYYPINNQIIFADVVSGSQWVAYSSPFGVLGTGNRRLAGGDGNDDVAGKILISHGGNHSNLQVLNLLTGRIELANGSSVPWDANSPRFDLPRDLDYATLSTLGNYIIAAIKGQGTFVYDFEGNRLGLLHGSANHMANLMIENSDGMLQQGIVVKLNNGQANQRADEGATPGDLRAVGFSVTDGGLVISERELLSWRTATGQALSGPAGGGQHSSFSEATLTSLVALNPTVGVRVDGHANYYNEIVELSLAANTAPARRIVQHLITTISPVADQPEAFLSPNGRFVYWKSDLLGTLPGSGHLYMTKLPLRTCPGALAQFRAGQIPSEVPPNDSDDTLKPDPDPDPDPDPQPDLDSNPDNFQAGDTPTITVFIHRGDDRYYLNWEPGIVPNGWSIAHYEVYLDGRRFSRRKRPGQSFRLGSVDNLCAQVKTTYTNGIQSPFSQEICLNPDTAPDIPAEPEEEPEEEKVIISEDTDDEGNNSEDSKDDEKLDPANPDDFAAPDTPQITSFLYRGSSRHLLTWQPGVVPAGKRIRNYEGWLNGRRYFRQSKTGRSFRLSTQGQRCMQIKVNYIDGSSSPFSPEICLD